MCLLAVQYRLVPESPILVAANREEYFDRSSLTPSIQSGKPRILCGIDQKAGGTWLGVNQNGLFDTFVSGVTDFDTYIATNPLHTFQDVGFEWFSANGDTTPTVEFPRLCHDHRSHRDLERGIRRFWQRQYQCID